MGDKVIIRMPYNDMIRFIKELRRGGHFYGTKLSKGVKIFCRSVKQKNKLVKESGLHQDFFEVDPTIQRKSKKRKNK